VRERLGERIDRKIVKYCEREKERKRKRECNRDREKMR
jgi:hypothetical protein